MGWDSRLSIEVIEVFAVAQAPHSIEVATAEAARLSALLWRHRETSRAHARQKRGGLKGYVYNDGRWRGRRPATRYVQLDLPYMEQQVMREKLPNDRSGIIQKFTILSKNPKTQELEETDIYLTANSYPDDYTNAARRGQLGEVFLTIGKAGGTEAVFDEWAKTTSKSLQYGVPVDDLFWQHVGTRFYPEGKTTNKDFPSCTSILDLVSRWILSRYGSAESKARITKMQVRQEQPVQP